MEQDTDAIVDTLKDALGSVLEQARNPPAMPNTHQTITLHHADPPAPIAPPPWHAWVCATAAIVSVLVAVGAVMFAVDARSEMRANNTNRERDIGELRQTDNAIRAYINAGKVPVTAKGK